MTRRPDNDSPAPGWVVAVVFIVFGVAMFGIGYLFGSRGWP